MRNSGRGSGGGLGMNKNVRPGYRTGAPNRAIQPGGAGQIGISIGTHITAKRTETNYRGEKFFGGSAISSKLGNELVTNVGAGGTGTGRTLYGQAGSQSTYGKPNPGNAPAKNRDILSEYGPDYRGRGSR